MMTSDEALGKPVLLVRTVKAVIAQWRVFSYYELFSVQQPIPVKQEIIDGPIILYSDMVGKKYQ